MMQERLKRAAAKFRRQGLFRHSGGLAKPPQLSFALQVCAETWLDTPKGWLEAKNLKAGQQVARLGGGYATLIYIAQTPLLDPCVLVPEGSLGASAPLQLPATAHVGYSPPSPLPYEAPYVALPAGALRGYQGVRAQTITDQKALLILLEEEEMIWTQTGLLLHAPVSAAQMFYQRLNYGQTRALLTLSDPKQLEPDLP